MKTVSSLRRGLLPCFLVLAAGLCLPGASLWAQKFVANEDESKVPAYELPPIFDARTAGATDFAAAWPSRRAELLQTFATQMYGTQPTTAFGLECERFELGECLNGTAVRQQWRVRITTEKGSLPIALLIYTPKNAKGKVPTFLGLNFGGNHTVASDPEIEIPQAWCRPGNNVVDNRATEAGRGSASTRWPLDVILGAGCGVATAYYGEIDPDFDDGFQNGIHPLFPQHQPTAEHPERWGSISAWAWGLSRLLDCLQQHVDSVDGKRVVVIGHSRLGKTSLWAGATDPRFAAVISNDSGCGGAALSRRAFGETVGRINDSFPYWFCGNFKQYNLNEAALPIDQHQLLALIAPRPVYVASASEDLWADPRGEFLSAKLAGDVYERFGKAGLKLEDLPPANTAEVGVVSYHLREGKHDINAWDWANYVQFIKQL